MELPPNNSVARSWGPLILPFDLQSQILSQNQQLLQQGMSLSRGTQARLRPTFLAQVCQQPISWTELQRYLATRPGRIATFEFFDRLELYHNVMISDLYERQVHGYNIEVGQAYLGIWSDGSVGLNVDVKVEVVNDWPLDSITEMPKLIDLWSMYQIYRQRLSCETLSRVSQNGPSFAKTELQRQFEAIVNNYHHWSPIPLLSELQFYLYLKNNALILGIEDMRKGHYDIPIYNLGQIIQIFNPNQPEPAKQRTIDDVMAANTRLTTAIRIALARLP